MDIYQTRQLLKTKSVYDIPLRVTFYARVSSESDAQLNSLDNQTKYYVDFIKKNKSWTYIEGYVDEGISAATTKNREDFHRMIDDACKDKFDLIITKEITRFARNTLDSITYTRKLLNYGVGVFFQNDNINTYDEDSELRLTIMSGIAQDELRKLSSRVKFGHQQAIKKGVVLGNSRIFGYVKNNGRLMIDDREAQMVRELFELYATDNYSMKQIENIFWNKGYRNLNGNKISHSTMSNMISNPKYKGYYVGNKVKIVDIFTKEQKFLPPEEWVMFKDETGEIVPAIVTEDVWNKANEILQRRSLDVKSRQNKCNHDNLLTGKLFCTHCGKAYYRKDAKYKGTITSRWVCSGKIKNGASTCPSFAIKEDEINQVILSAIKSTSKSVDKYIDKYISLFKESKNKNSTFDITKYQNIIYNAEKKANKLLEYNVNGKLSDSEFLRLNEQCTLEINEAKAKISELEALEEQQLQLQQRLIEIKSVLKKMCNDDNIKEFKLTKHFINQYIDKIYIQPDENGVAHVQIKIFTGEIIEQDYGRSGHTFKKICPEEIKTFVRINRRAYGHTVFVKYNTCVGI